MNAREARQIVYAGLLHVPKGDGTFSPDRADRALQFIGEDFASVTRCIRQTDDITINPSNHLIDFTTEDGFDRFSDIHFIRASIDDHEVKINPSLASVRRRYAGQTLPTGTPSQIAFEGPDRAWLYPEPNDTYTLSVYRWMPFTQWTPGIEDSDAADVELNLPDEYMTIAARLGAVAVMVFSDPNSTYTQIGLTQYLNFRNEIARQFRPGLDLSTLSDAMVYKLPPVAAAPGAAA